MRSDNRGTRIMSDIDINRTPLGGSFDHRRRNRRQRRYIDSGIRIRAKNRQSYTKARSANPKPG